MSDGLTIIGHRGFRGKYEENTLRGFKECYAAKATGIELDLYLTKDNVVVVSHDATTCRMFRDENGNIVDKNILDSTYSELKGLRTVKEREKLLTFGDVLNWFVKYDEENGYTTHKLMLDIKKENPAKVVKYILKDLLSVKEDIQWWFPRIQFGIWDLNIVKYMNQPYFQEIFGKVPNYGLPSNRLDIVHISFAWQDSMHFLAYNDYLDSLPDKDLKLKVTGVSLLYVLTWSYWCLVNFLPKLRRHNMKLYSWTVNTFDKSLYHQILGCSFGIIEYGIVTDYPDVMVEFHKRENNVISKNILFRQDQVRAKYLGKKINEDQCVSEAVYASCSWGKVLLTNIWTFVLWLRGNIVTKDELEFNSVVDDNYRGSFHTIVLRILKSGFQLGQRYGIF